MGKLSGKRGHKGPPKWGGLWPERVTCLGGRGYALPSGHRGLGGGRLVVRRHRDDRSNEAILSLLGGLGCFRGGLAGRPLTVAAETGAPPVLYTVDLELMAEIGAHQTFCPSALSPGTPILSGESLPGANGRGHCPSRERDGSRFCSAGACPLPGWGAGDKPPHYFFRSVRLRG